MSMVYLESPSTDPAFNLALEQFVFDEMPRDQEYFMLWQNKNAIIVGKYQNTAAEINAAYVKEHDIQVIRRLSGGGAVPACGEGPGPAGGDGGDHRPQRHHH